MKFTLALLLVLLFSAAVQGKPEEDGPPFMANKRRLLMVANAGVMAGLPEEIGSGFARDGDDTSEEPPKKKRAGHKARKRTRRSVKSIHKELSPEYFHPAYHMDYVSFRALHKLLRPVLLQKS